MRKPVAAVAVLGGVVVVCEDGSVWAAMRLDTDAEWKKVAPIPGSEADPTSGE